MEMAIIPKNKINIATLLLEVILLTCNKMYPTNRLKQAHKTLSVGEDNPLAGGFAKGVGKASPDTP